MMHDTDHAFASSGARKHTTPLLTPLATPSLELGTVPRPIRSRLCHDSFWGDSAETLQHIIAAHAVPAPTLHEPATLPIAAGKNTYAYDAHPYHTKVPPQGIAELLRRYLPAGGVVLAPFAGSGMTGVAARAMEIDVILNDLLPAASFIAYHMTRQYDPAAFLAGVRGLLDHHRDLRNHLYATRCRSCGTPTEVLFTVWSYRAVCYHCGGDFLMWDHCRSYGKRVRDHKIVSAFPCPHCGSIVQKKTGTTNLYGTSAAWVPLLFTSSRRNEPHRRRPSASSVHRSTSPARRRLFSNNRMPRWSQPLPTQAPWTHLC